MNKSIVRILRIDIVFIWACSQITFLTDVNFTMWIDKNPNSNVEFSLFDEKGSFDIFLDDKTIMFILGFTLFNQWFDFILWLFFFWNRSRNHNLLFVFSRTILTVLITVLFIDSLYLFVIVMLGGSDFVGWVGSLSWGDLIIWRKLNFVFRLATDWAFERIRF